MQSRPVAAAVRAQLPSWILVLAIFVAPGLLRAQDATAEEAPASAPDSEVLEAEAAGLPEPVETAPADPPHPPVPASAPTADGGAALGGLRSGHRSIQLAGFQLNGRFDLAFEIGGFAVDGAGEPRASAKNYHHFVFLTRNQEDEWFSFNAELVDLSFYEVGLKLGPGHQLRFGKILVPFGADPLFHHAYGGLSGIDQKLLPFVWAEHGVAYAASLYQSPILALDNEVYAITGIAGDQDQVLRLSGVSGPGTVAFGDRLRLGYDVFAASASVYWSRYAGDFNMLLWGLDFSAGYGFLPWPHLDDLAVKVGFLRADVQGSQASGLSDYYHFGDYLQLDYRLPWSMGVRYRTGIVTMHNGRGLFFDDRLERKGADDTLAHGFTLWKRHRGFSVAAEFVINIESAGEVDNDLFRLTAALDF